MKIIVLIVCTIALIFDCTSFGIAIRDKNKTGALLDVFWIVIMLICLGVNIYKLSL